MRNNFIIIFGLFMLLVFSGCTTQNTVLGSLKVEKENLNFNEEFKVIIVLQNKYSNNVILPTKIEFYYDETALELVEKPKISKIYPGDTKNFEYKFKTKIVEGEFGIEARIYYNDPIENKSMVIQPKKMVKIEKK